jgi:glycerol uptake facilitator protein
MWVPIVGPLIGGIVGVLIYDLFIGDVLHARQIRSLQASGLGRTPPGPDTLEN